MRVPRHFAVSIFLEGFGSIFHFFAIRGCHAWVCCVRVCCARVCHARVYSARVCNSRVSHEGFAMLGFATLGFAVCGDSKNSQSCYVRYHLQHKNHFLEKKIKVTFSGKFQFEVNIPTAQKSRNPEPTRPSFSLKAQGAVLCFSFRDQYLERT